MEFGFQVPSVNLGSSNSVMISKPKKKVGASGSWMLGNGSPLNIKTIWLRFNSKFYIVIVVFLNKDKALDPLYSVKYLLEISLITLL